jgi:hypothetical protein
MSTQHNGKQLSSTNIHEKTVLAEETSAYPLHDNVAWNKHDFQIYLALYTNNPLVFITILNSLLRLRHLH